MIDKRNLIIVLFCVFMQNIFGQEKPNIRFILADDQTFESLGTINNDEIKTPNLDKLIKQGTLFTHAFNQGSWSPAVCLASSAMLNKGQFVWNAQKTPFDVSDGENVEEKIVKEKGVTPWSILMKQVGYELDLSTIFEKLKRS